MILNSLLSNRRFLATFSVASASASTVIYLLFFYQREDSTSFTHLYSTVMIFSGWLNTFSFLGGLERFFKKWIEAILYVILIFTFTVLTRKIFFHEATSIREILFLIGCASLTFMTPFLRLLYQAGEFKIAYIRIIFVNTFLFFVAFAALLSHSRFVLEIFSFFAIFLAAFFNQKTVNYKYKSSSSSEEYLAKYLNPNSLIIERAIFDQKYLILQGAVEQTLLYYFLSRFISFLGTVSFSLGIESVLSKRKTKPFPYFYLIIILLSIVVWIFARSWGVLAYILLGQIQLWLIVKNLTLLSNYQTLYMKLFVICLFDIGFRWLALESIEKSAAWLLVSISGLALCFFLSERFYQKSHLKNV